MNVSQLKLRSEKFDNDDDDDDNNNNNQGKNTDIHIQNMSYLLPFHGNNGYANGLNVTLYVLRLSCF
jgi:hypothetical protein